MANTPLDPKPQGYNETKSTLADVAAVGAALVRMSKKPFVLLGFFANQSNHRRERKQLKTRQIPGIGGESHRGNHRGGLFRS